MTIPFSQVKPASLKMKVLPRYPGAYRAGPGIAIAQASGIVTTSVDFANLVRDDITDPTSLYVAGWDNANHLFKLVLGSNLKGAKGDTGATGTTGAANASDYATRALAAAATISAGIQYLRVAGYAAAGDGGDALYRKVGSAPSHSGKFQSVDGAWWEVVGPVYNWRAFGAVGDGVANDTAAIQGTIDAAVLVGGESYGPPGTYKLLTGLSITGRMRLYGSGSDEIFSSFTGKSTSLIVAASINAIFVNTPKSAILEKFGIRYSVAPGAGVGIILDAPGGGTIANTESVIRDVSILGADTGIKTINAQVFCIDHVSIWNSVTCGAFLQWVNVPGSGDSNFTNSVLSGAASLAQVAVKSGGGLRFVNNKINGGGLSLLVSPDQVTAQGISPLFICNNSMEGASTISVLFQRLAGITEVVGNLVMVGNEVGGPNGGIIMQTSVTNPTVPWVLVGVVSGNLIAGVSAGQACIQIAGAKEINVVGNQLSGASGATGLAIDGPSTANIGNFGNNKGAGVL